MNRPSIVLLSALLGLGASSLSLASRVPTILIEASVEAEAGDLSLPASLGGIITVRSCSTCSAQTFYFGKDPLLMLDGRKVDLQQMSLALRKAGSTPVTVHYNRSDSTVTRIVMSGESRTAN
ncbi:MAG: hypothetical protein JSR95_18645 [Proteobacteria bacterium]|nr:hypothetical protein [Pseudomonadota bacterium]